MGALKVVLAGSRVEEGDAFYLMFLFHQMVTLIGLLYMTTVTVSHVLAFPHALAGQWQSDAVVLFYPKTLHPDKTTAKFQL